MTMERKKGEKKPWTYGDAVLAGIGLAAGVALLGGAANDANGYVHDRWLENAETDHEAALEELQLAEGTYQALASAACNEFWDNVYPTTTEEREEDTSAPKTAFNAYVDAYEHDGVRVCGELSEAQLSIGWYHQVHEAGTEEKSTYAELQAQRSIEPNDSLGLRVGAVIAGVAGAVTMSPIRRQQ